MTRNRRSRPRASLFAAGLGLLATASLLLVLATGSGGGGPSTGWTLTRDDGARVHAADFRGRWMLVFFGYTSCRDVCPTTLATIADALHVLGPGARRFATVFVTVDPVRDTPEAVHRYVRAFDPSFVGLTGTPAEIRAVEARFGVRADASDPERVEHDAVLLLVPPDGGSVVPLSASLGAEALARRLARL